MMFDNLLWRSVDGRYVVCMSPFAARMAWGNGVQCVCD